MHLDFTSDSRPASSCSKLLPEHSPPPADAREAVEELAGRVWAETAD